MKHAVALGLCLATLPVHAFAQDKDWAERLRKQDERAELKAEMNRAARALDTPSSDVRVWVDVDTGCRYYISDLSRTFGQSAYSGIPTIRYRADGKPDCKDVK